MGNITEAKRIYDELAANYFLSKSWHPHIIKLPGRWASDLIAENGNDLAIIEVKSLCEQSYVKNYVDTKNISGGLPLNIITHLSLARNTINQSFPNQPQSTLNLKVSQLYAVTVACQLYRYYYEFDYVATIYKKWVSSTLIANITAINKQAFLVVPLEYAAEAAYAMNFLKSIKYIASFSTNGTTRICVLRITY